jgi:hypothetical protein
MAGSTPSSTDEGCSCRLLINLWACPRHRVGVVGDGDLVAIDVCTAMAFTRASSRAAFASSSVANPPTHRGLLTPDSGSLTRRT